MTEQPSEQIFVGQERELAQLHRFLEQALSGRGQACFVTGEAGSGKTSLVTEFARQAQEAHEDLLLALGSCNAQTGAGDAYLPFREVLDMLTGNVEGQGAKKITAHKNVSRLKDFAQFSVRTLVEVGPDLIGIFIPAGGLLIRLGTALAKKGGWLMDQLESKAKRKPPAIGEIEQSHIFEQYTRVLTTLAQERPLLLVLDDLHWADSGSIDLLFRLGRRIGESRVLVVGTYRPDEIALGRAGQRHPLEPVLAELKRYAGEMLVDLGQSQETGRRQFVDALLEAMPNRLDDDFRQALFLRTGGHPLFVVELLRDMQERGGLVQDEQGLWIAGPALSWETVPARVEGVIESRIGRLEAGQRAILSAASVEGEEFTAEAVARVQHEEERGLVRQLSGELAAQHHLVNARGVQRVGSARLSGYRFSHNLFQRYLYTSLDQVERSYMHEDIGNALEALYGEQADEIAVQLARHFSEASLAEKARHYLQRAGEQAAARSANAEALSYFNRALELTPPSDPAGRHPLLAARERLYDLQGNRAAQAQDLQDLERLAETLDDRGPQGARRRAEVAVRQARFFQATADYPKSVAAAQVASVLAQAAQDKELEIEAYMEWGGTLWRWGDYPPAEARLEQALELARATGLRRLEQMCLRQRGSVALGTSDYAKARYCFEPALQISRELADRSSEAAALSGLGHVFYSLGDYSQARACYEQALQLCRALGDRRREGTQLGNLGVVSSGVGHLSEAVTCYEQALAIYREVGDRYAEGCMLSNLGFLRDKLGYYGPGREHGEQALALFRQIGNRWGEGLVLPNLALNACHRGDNAAGLGYSQQALEATRASGDRSNQAFALTYMGHALFGLDRLDGAAAAYQEAVALRRELKLENKAMESLAGLARVRLAQGDDAAAALAHVEEILTFLQTGTLDGTDEPFRIYLTCCQVLQSHGDSRAAGLHQDALALLQERAAAIADEEMRRSFLENVTAHRELRGIW